MILPLDEIAVEALHQWHEVELCVEIEGSDKLKSRLLPKPHDLRDAMQEAALSTNNNESSRYHLEASTILNSLAFNHEIEVPPFPNSRFLAIDVACRHRMVALEFNGPYHYNDDGKPNGRTMMKKRLLHKLGWRLYVVPWWEWDCLKDGEEKVEYLRGVVKTIEVIERRDRAGKQRRQSPPSRPRLV
jgi:hypothetical protein